VSEGCSHKFEVGGTCVRCGEPFAAVQLADLQGLVERYAAMATEATRVGQELSERALELRERVNIADAEVARVTTIARITAEGADKALERARRAEAELRELRIQHAAGGNEPHWLTKDFNVLYAAAFAFSEACHGRGDGKPYGPQRDLDAQLARLKPAFTETEEVKRRVRDKGGE